MLYADFKKYCEQIGIPESHNLLLATGHDELREMMLRRHSEYKLNRTLKIRRVYYQRLGQCDNELGIIFVDAHIKRIIHKDDGIKHDATYADHLDTLIHELVHYRFKLKDHSTKKFKKLEKRILEGERFSLMEIEAPTNKIQMKEK
jgi:hypothetical protein